AMAGQKSTNWGRRIFQRCLRIWGTSPIAWETDRAGCDGVCLSQPHALDAVRVAAEEARRVAHECGGILSADEGALLCSQQQEARGDQQKGTNQICDGRQASLPKSRGAGRLQQDRVNSIPGSSLEVVPGISPGFLQTHRASFGVVSNCRGHCL